MPNQAYYHLSDSACGSTAHLSANAEANATPAESGIQEDFNPSGFGSVEPTAQ